MTRKNTIISLLILLIIQSCTVDNETEYNDIIVVEAYLYTGKNLDSIKITKVLPYDNSNDTIIYVNNLDITLSTNNQSYLFSQSSNNPSYYKINSGNLIINENTEYSIFFNYDSQEISASTISPGSVDSFSISDTIIYISDDNFGHFFDDENEIEFEWANTQEEYFMLSIQLTDTTSLEDRRIFDNAEDPATSLLMPPTSNNTMMLNGRMLQYFGEYMTVLFKINEEYMELYESLNQNSTSLIESPTNIENGKGIFTSLSSDTLYFSVEEQ